MTAGSLIDTAVAALAAAGIENPRLEAELLMAYALGTNRAGVIARLRDPGHEVGAVFEGLVARREKREPLQYITGTCSFMGREFAVGPGVLIPRPETELLVEAGLSVLADGEDRIAVDIGAGSGCIAVSLALGCPGLTVYAIDSSQTALTLASKNIESHKAGDNVKLLSGDIFAPLRNKGLAGRVDLIVSNPPYIPTGDIPGLQPEVLYEPLNALDGGPDGLDVIKRIVAAAPEMLAPGGFLMVEIGFNQADAVEKLIEAQRGIQFMNVMDDFAGIGRVVVACRL